LEKRARLTQRDVLLFGHLAVARYLTSRQVAELVFPGRVDRVVRRRLEMLAATTGVGAHIAAPKYRAFNGTPMVAWKITELGYAKAEHCLGRDIKVPSKDVGHQVLAHTIALNDLYVALATSGRVSRVGSSMLRPPGSRFSGSVPSQRACPGLNTSAIKARFRTSASSPTRFWKVRQRPAGGSSNARWAGIRCPTQTRRGYAEQIFSASTSMKSNPASIFSTRAASPCNTTRA